MVNERHEVIEDPTENNRDLEPTGFETQEQDNDISRFASAAITAAVWMRIWVGWKGRKGRGCKDSPGER